MKFRYSSDRSLLLYFDGDSPALQVRRALFWFEQNRLPGVLNLHPAYGSLLVVFDPVQIGHDELRRQLSSAAMETLALPEPREIHIPVHYDGPDIGDVAAIHGLSSSQVAELHSAALYTVDFLGFVPGFAYLSGLDPRLATPRLPAPRTSVPAGSVGIAGSQTGVYPFATPGGWRLIGRTDAKMFDTSRAGLSLLRIGDQVRFTAL